MLPEDGLEHFNATANPLILFCEVTHRFERVRVPGISWWLPCLHLLTVFQQFKNMISYFRIHSVTSHGFFAKAKLDAYVKIKFILYSVTVIFPSYQYALYLTWVMYNKSNDQS